MKKKYLPECLTGLLCAVLLFGGACALSKDEDSEQGSVTPTTEAEKNDTGSENDAADKDSVGAEKDDTGKDTQENEETSGGALINGMFGSNADLAGSELLDKKAEYIMQLIDSYFLYEVEDGSYETEIYRALMNACGDPYSCYYTPEEYDELMESTTGTYCGIGCLVSQDVRTMLISIVRPFSGSPAANAGIKAGDVVYKVDGEIVTGQDINLVVSKMKGPENTEVTVTVYRESTGEYIDCTMKRAFIEVETVTWEKLKEDNHKIGLITVTQFEEVTLNQFETALKELDKWGMEGLVIDLRDNPGGLLDTVSEMLDVMLPKGLTVYMQDKYGNREEYKSDADCYDIPLTVLINGNSASASEIFAGAIQDYEAGTIVGTQSFGKGIVQSVIPLSDGSAVKMTIADYYTPLGRNIHGVGIAPDVEVELPDGEYATSVEREKDTQLRKALDILIDEIK